jgi:hypothetical protein
LDDQKKKKDKKKSNWNSNVNMKSLFKCY